MSVALLLNRSAILRPRSPSSPMSLNVNGKPVSSVAFYPGPRSYISSAFHSSLPRVSGTQLLVTTNVPQPLFSTMLDFEVAPTLDNDVVLGFDWSSRVREYLLLNNYRLDSTFDAWLYFSLPSHPLCSLIVYLDNCFLISPQFMPPVPRIHRHHCLSPQVHSDFILCTLLTSASGSQHTSATPHTYLPPRNPGAFRLSLLLCCNLFISS